MGCCAKICRTRVDEQISNGQLLQFTHSLDVRIRLAVDRLLYAQKLFQVGPSYLQQLVHLEQQHCGDQAWICGLHADLQWLHRVLPQAVPGGEAADLTVIIEFWQQGAPQWKSIVKRAARRHLLQEEIMVDAKVFHKRILQGLRSVGATDEDQATDDRRELHHCFCGRTFTSLHRRKQHGLHAPEYQFTTGATCPACLRHFWTSNRLAMHLAYAPRDGGVNPCFDMLSRAQFSGGFCAQTAPPSHANAVRLDAVQTAGPLPYLPDHRLHQLEELTTEIDNLAAMVNDYAKPIDHIDQGLQLGDALTTFTQCWVRQHQKRGREEMPDLMDGWIRLLHAKAMTTTTGWPSYFNNGASTSCRRSLPMPWMGRLSMCLTSSSRRWPSSFRAQNASDAWRICDFASTS